MANLSNETYEPQGKQEMWGFSTGNFVWEEADQVKEREHAAMIPQ